MNTSAGLSPENVTIAGGHAALAWLPQSLDWSAGPDFAPANGTADSNVTVGASGLSLAGNGSNRLSNANFTSAAAWTYVNGTSKNVTANWDPAAQDARLAYAAPSTVDLWDGFNSTASLAVNWSASASPGNSVAAFEVTHNPAPPEGAGLVGLEVTLWTTPGWIRLQRQSSADWSGVDRLVLWFKMNSTLAVTFDVSARIGTGGPTRSTPAVPLTSGWQRIAVDLNALGNASERADLQNLRLEISGQSIPASTWFFLDDLEIGNARIFHELAQVGQTFDKRNATSPLPGSAYVSFDWCLENATNVSGYSPGVSVGAWQGSFRGSVGSWHAYTADVSPYVAATGTYTLGVHLDVSANDTLRSNVTLRIDNASFVYPDRHNGSYESVAKTFGTASSFVTLTWTASIATGTDVSVSIRTGNSSLPGTAGWGSWQKTSGPGTHPLNVSGARYFQILSNLTTTNASRTPVLASLSVAAQTRVIGGVLTSRIFNVSSDFLRWRSFSASVQVGGATSISFFVGDESYWTSSADLSSFIGRSIRWRAILNTTDGLQTPLLASVRIVYEFLGTPSTVVITPGGVQQLTVGGYARFHAAISDSGGHNLSAARVNWSTDDTSGMIWSNGTYLAGSVGVHHVTATVNGTSVNSSVVVQVVPSGGAGWTLGDVVPYLVLILVAAAGGYAVYELSLRRRFAIDDVFLIARDGRLMSHNTRRILPEQDEDILSGMLTAINSFVRDSWREENGHMRRFDFGGRTTLIERGEHVFLAVVYSGHFPKWASRDLRAFVRDLEARFGDAFAKWDGSPEDLQNLKRVMGRFVSRMRYSRRRVWSDFAA